MRKPKKIAEGEFTEDIYSVNDRYPLDRGQSVSKSDIDAMFNLEYPKGTKLVLFDEGGEFGDEFKFWYLKKNYDDGGWDDSCKWTKKFIKTTKLFKK